MALRLEGYVFRLWRLEDDSAFIELLCWDSGVSRKRVEGKEKEESPCHFSQLSKQSYYVWQNSRQYFVSLLWWTNTETAIPGYRFIDCGWRPHVIWLTNEGGHRWHCLSKAWPTHTEVFHFFKTVWKVVNIVYVQNYKHLQNWKCAGVGNVSGSFCPKHHEPLWFIISTKTRSRLFKIKKIWSTIEGLRPPGRECSSAIVSGRHLPLGCIVLACLCLRQKKIWSSLILFVDLVTTALELCNSGLQTFYQTWLQLSMVVIWLLPWISDGCEHRLWGSQPRVVRDIVSEIEICGAMVSLWTLLRWNPHITKSKSSFLMCSHCFHSPGHDRTSER